MAIIDLRHLIEPEHDEILIIGSDDKKEYKMPIKKTMGMIVMLNQYFMDYTKIKDPEQIDAITNIDLNYRMVTAWMRGVYQEITLEWVKNNICDSLFTELVKILEPLFFPVVETGKPKRPRKNRLS